MRAWKPLTLLGCAEPGDGQGLLQGTLGSADPLVSLSVTPSCTREGAALAPSIMVFNVDREDGSSDRAFNVVLSQALVQNGSCSTCLSSPELSWKAIKL